MAAASYLYMYYMYCADAMEIINRVSVLLATVLYKCLTARGFCAGLSCLDFQGPWASECVFVFEIQGCFCTGCFDK